MNRPNHAVAKMTVGSIVVVGVVVVSMVACSASDKADPKNSPGSTSSSAPGASSGGPKDESAAVLGWTPPTASAASGTTQGKLSPGRSSGGKATIPATAEIISVQSSASSTILTWQLSSATDIPIQGVTLTETLSARTWPDGVRLVDAAGKKSYAVNTMHAGLNTYCVCSSFPRHVGPDPVRMTSEYPPLPSSVTTISVRIPNFAPVTVPVTR